MLLCMRPSVFYQPVKCQAIIYFVAQLASENITDLTKYIATPARQEYVIQEQYVCNELKSTSLCPCLKTCLLFPPKRKQMQARRSTGEGPQPKASLSLHFLCLPQKVIHTQFPLVKILCFVALSILPQLSFDKYILITLNLVSHLSNFLFLPIFLKSISATSPSSPFFTPLPTSPFLSLSCLLLEETLLWFKMILYQ